jgi:hypothetical protein
MSIAVPPSHNENTEASGTFNTPQTVSHRNFMNRANSSPDAMFVVVKAFAGAVIGAALGAMMFSAAGLPYSWVGLMTGAALGATYAIGKYPRP